MAAAARGSINVSISGPDLNTVTQLSNQAQGVLQTVPGVVDVRNSNLNTVPELDITLDRTRMAQLGVTNQQVDQALSSAIGGSTVTEFQPPGTQQEDITLLADPAERYDLTTLGQIPVGVESAAGGTGTGAATTAAPPARDRHARPGGDAHQRHGAGHHPARQPRGDGVPHARRRTAEPWATSPTTSPRR